MVRSTRQCSSRTGPSTSRPFGDFTQSTFLSHAVYGFFNNGGSRCYVVNVGAPANLDLSPADTKAAAERPRL